MNLYDENFSTLNRRNQPTNKILTTKDHVPIEAEVANIVFSNSVRGERKSGYYYEKETFGQLLHVFKP